MLKPVGKMRRNGKSIQSQSISLQDTITIGKGRNMRDTLTKVIKVNTTSNKPYQPEVNPDVMPREGYNITPVVFLPKMQNLHLIVRNYQASKRQSPKKYSSKGSRS